MALVTARSTIMEATVHPPRVERLHYEFEDWLGDDLVESFPSFLVATWATVNPPVVDPSGVDERQDGCVNDLQLADDMLAIKP